MATSKQKLTDDFLTCHICMEVYQQPCTLHCEHTYCKGCLTKYIQTQADAIKAGYIPCPSCRRHITVPHPDRPATEWAGQFKAGLVIQGLMDSLIHDSADKIPISRPHLPTVLSEDTPQVRVKRKKFICKEHDKKIKLFCKDCRKPLCTVCCSLDHRACKDVVTIQAMLPEIKQDLADRQKKQMNAADKTSRNVTEIKKIVQEFVTKSAKVKDEIKKTINDAVHCLKQKEKKLLDKLEDITNRQTEELRAKIKSEEIMIQMYQQQSHFIQQTL